jgi:hypothetical protein
MLRLILNLLGIKPKAPRVYLSDDGGRFVVVTGHKVTPDGSLETGRLVDADGEWVGDEELVGSMSNKESRP